jgi:hypothetical protein
MNHFSSSNILSEKIFQFWWMLLIGGMVGGIIAFISTYFLVSPDYLAEAKMSIIINFKEVGHLSQYEQDQMIGNVISMFQSNDITEETIDLLGDDMVSISEFRNSCFMERQVNTLFFRCISNDPVLSQKWVNHWANISYDKLSTAYGHALQFEKLQRKQDSFELCVQRSYDAFPSSSDCKKLISDQFTQEQLIAEIEYERLNSKNIFPGFKFSEITSAEIPQKPVRNNTNIYVLTGSLFGFIISFIFLQTRKNETK